MLNQYGSVLNIIKNAITIGGQTPDISEESCQSNKTHTQQFQLLQYRISLHMEDVLLKYTFYLMLTIALQTLQMKL